ncbi:MAG: MarC family protein [Treponema sp.]|nr:MarC family protein [Treponema sp.]
MLTQFLQQFFTLLLIVDPIGSIPSFLAVTGEFDMQTRKKVVHRAILVAGIVLLIFVVFGRLLLGFFGISPSAFYISGGVIFFTIAFEMIQSKPRSRTTPASSIDPQDSMMVAVFPLATPLIAGPGMITTIMMQVSAEDFTTPMYGLLALAVILALIVEMIALRCGSIILRLIGTTGMFVLEKIMGLILAGLAVQLIIDGLAKAGFIKALI